MSVAQAVYEDPYAVIPSVASVKFEGELCGSATPATALTSSNSIVTTIFDAASLEYSDAPATKGCTVTVQLDVPSGFEVGMPLVIWRGDANNAVVTRTYAYGGEDASEPFSEQLPDGGYMLSDKPALWSPTCDDDVQRVTFVSTIEVSVSASEDTFVLHSFDFNTTASAGVEWAHCDGTPVTPPTDDGDDSQDKQEQPADEGLAALIPGAAGFEVDGELCGPPMSLSISFDDTTRALGTVGFDFAALYYQGAPAAASCTIAVQLEVPTGYRLGMPVIAWHGLANNSVVTRTYAYEGEPPSAPISEIVPPDVFLVDHANLTSPTCGGTQRVRFLSTIEASVAAEDEFFILDDFNIDTRAELGVEWASCDAP